MPRRRTTRRTPSRSLARRAILVLALYALAAILSLGSAIGASAFTPQWADAAAMRMYENLSMLPNDGPHQWNNWIGECEYVRNPRHSDGEPAAWYSYRFGFPFRCAYSQATWETHIDDFANFGSWYEATSLWEIKPSTGYPEDGPPQEQPEALTLATGILPLGLLANTLTLGTALLLAILATRTAIAHRRHRKGRCPACGYTLAGLPATTPCPECGSESARTRAAP